MSLRAAVATTRSLLKVSTVDIRYFALAVLLATTLIGCDSRQDNSLRTFFGHSDNVCAVQFSPDGKRIVSGGADGKIKVWNLAKECLMTLDGDKGWVHSVALDPDGRHLASGGRDECVKLWDLESGEVQHVLAGHTGIVMSVAFSPDGRLVASCGRGESFLALDANGGASARTQGFSIAVWDAASGKRLKTLDPGGFFQPSEVRFTPDGKQLLFAGDSLQLLDVETGECVQVFEGHSDSIGAIAISRNGKWIASAGSFQDHTIRLWDAKSGKCIWVKQPGVEDGGKCWSLAFAADDKLLISGSRGVITFWNSETGVPVRRFKAHSDIVSCLSVDSTGRALASGGWDKAIKLWQVTSDGATQR